MLEFYARKYLEISHRFGVILASLSEQKPDPKGFGKAIEIIVNEADRLNLKVTKDVAARLLIEFIGENPNATSIKDGTLTLENAHISPQRTAHYVETLHATLCAEIGSMSVLVVPPEKARFLNPKWLFDTLIYNQFPNAWKEFQAAGRCHAYGENTACAFHLSRALEWGLKSLAVHLGRRFDRNCWERHLEDIEKELKIRRDAGKPRSPEERFYSDTASDFSNMKVAWRNPTMHIDAHYDDREGKYLLDCVENFINHLAKNGIKECEAP